MININITGDIRIVEQLPCPGSNGLEKPSE